MKDRATTFRPVRLVVENLARRSWPCFRGRMGEHEANTLQGLAGSGTRVQVGSRTYRIRTQVVVEEVDDGHTGQVDEVRQRGDGSFEMLLSEADATSIDKSEQALLATSLPAIRAALSQHLTSVSKKKPKKR